jgi:gliding motility-associated-like protein
LYTVHPTTIGRKGFFVSGTTNGYGIGMYDNIMMRLDTAGNIIWARTVGGTDTEYGGFGIQANDGGFAIASEGKSYGAGMMDYYLVKTDSLGFSGCNQTSPTVPVTIMNPTKNTLLNTNSGGGKRNPGLTLVFPPTQVDSVCCVIPIASYAANDTTVCGNISLSIGTSISPGMHYLWRPGATLNDSTIANPIASPIDTTTYKVFVYNDCGDTLTDSLTIKTITAPIVLVASSQTQICEGDSAFLTASGPGTYSWSIGSTNATIAVSPTNSALYTVTLSNGQCNDTANVNITVNLVQAIVTGDTSICKGSSTSLSASGGVSYLWSNGMSNSSISVSPTILTTYTVNSYNGLCADSSQITVRVNDPPVAEAGPNVSIALGSSATLSSSGGSSCTWSPSTNLSCVACCSPIASPTRTTTYYVTVTDANGCTSTDSITVGVTIDCGELMMPNAFSPNNDNMNDELKIYSSTGCLKEFTLTIYNRWGEKVYVTSDPHFSWNGIYNNEELNTQVLVYLINGLLTDNSSITRSGNVSLVR